MCWCLLSDRAWNTLTISRGIDQLNCASLTDLYIPLSSGGTMDTSQIALIPSCLKRHSQSLRKLNLALPPVSPLPVFGVIAAEWITLLHVTQLRIASRGMVDHHTSAPILC